MSALGDARTALGQVLASVGVPVHVYPPGTLTPPCVALYPGDDYCTPRGHTDLDVTCYANAAGGNQAAQMALDDMVEAVRRALHAGGVPFGITRRPQTEPDIAALSAVTPVTVRTNCP